MILFEVEGVGGGEGGTFSTCRNYFFSSQPLQDFFSGSSPLHKFIYLFTGILFFFGGGEGVGSILYCCSLNLDTGLNVIAWNRLQTKMF